MATVSANPISKGVTSKIQEVQKLTVTFGAGDDITITHADDPLWARQISVYTSAGVQLDITDETADALTVTAASATTTTIVSAGALTDAVIVCVVPVT